MDPAFIAIALGAVSAGLSGISVLRKTGGANSKEQLRRFLAALSVRSKTSADTKDEPPSAEASDRSTRKLQGQNPEFLAAMSHDLRSPLHAMLEAVRLHKTDHELSRQQLAGLETIQSSGAGLLALIDDVLNPANMDPARSSTVAAIRIADLTLGIVDVIRAKAESKRLTFVCELATDIPLVIEADERRLRLVLLNLLENAVRFTNEGTVTLGVRLHSKTDEQARLKFEVRDTGIGIDAEELPALFEPFERNESSQSQPPSAGLGLAISQQLVRLMGSEIHVESDLGVGSVFWFEASFPVHPADGSRLST